jgi:hypothetical protein
MNRLDRVHRLWMGRRVALLGGSAAAAALAFALQLVRLRLEPDGAAVHGVALLVTLIVFVILLRLVRLQLAGPGLDAPSWERHEHRASLREAPLVALAGLGIAAFMLVATPRLVAEERPAATNAIAIQTPEPVRAPEAPAMVPVELAYKPANPAPAFDEAGAAVAPRLVEVNYRWSVPGQDEEPRNQDPVDPTRPGRDGILRVQPDEPRLPPVHFGLGALLANAKGSLDLSGDSGRFQLDLDTVRGEETFEMGLDVTAEFALTPESAIKIIYAGVAFLERGRLGGGEAFGSSTPSQGDRYEFEMRWSHLYMGLAKRLTREKSFEVTVHAGAMVDHTLAEFESTASGVSAESEDGERGWVSLGAGFTLAVRGAGPAGLVLEFVQSAPLNIGGQAIALTDVRLAGTLDLSERVSLFAGYRYVRAVYRLFEAPLVREDGETAADLAVRGPVFGMDFRF